MYKNSNIKEGRRRKCGDFLKCCIYIDILTLLVVIVNSKYLVTAHQTKIEEFVNQLCKF